MMTMIVVFLTSFDDGNVVLSSSARVLLNKLADAFLMFYFCATASAILYSQS